MYKIVFISIKNDMKFEHSNLPRHSLVEKAFQVALERSTEGAALENAVTTVKRNMDAWYEGMLKHNQDAFVLRDEFDRANKRLADEQADNYSHAEEVARNALEGNFDIISVETARNVCEAADNPTPQLIAAVLLAPTVSSDDDIDVLRKDFGNDVAEILSALHHMKDDPDLAGMTAEELEDFKDDPVDPEIEMDNLKQASPDVKTAYLAIQLTMLDHEVVALRSDMRGNPRLKTAGLEAGREDRLHEIAQAVHGVNPLMDRDYRDAFNQLSSLTSSPWRLSIDRVGDLEMKRYEEPQLQKVQPKTKPQEKPTSPEVGLL